MPDLGKYSETVLSAYAVSIVLILGLVLVSLIRAKNIKRRLHEVEMKAKKHG